MLKVDWLALVIEFSAFIYFLFLLQSYFSGGRQWVILLTQINRSLKALGTSGNSATTWLDFSLSERPSPLNIFTFHLIS
jgi:hypothetical protein